nr:MAG TPA: hypothetical protein [Caudoviricetes sp.]
MKGYNKRALNIRLWCYFFEFRRLFTVCLALPFHPLLFPLFSPSFPLSFFALSFARFS